MPLVADVFVNYDPSDDAASINGAAGWVSTIKRALALRLRGVTGIAPVVQSALDADANAASCATMVCVVSSKAVLSADWSGRIETFLASKNSTVSATERLFVVAVNPVAAPSLPAPLRTLPVVELSLQNENVAADDKKFWTKIDDVANDIAAALKRLQGSPDDEDDEAIPKNVFLAESSADLRIVHDGLRRELQRHGYVLLPQRTLPQSTTEIEQRVREDLAHADLSIHLIGAEYGAVPSGGKGESTVALLHRLALDESHRRSSFRHLIWIPPGLVASDPQQESFLATLRNFSDVGQGTELVQSPLEDFKTLVDDILRPTTIAVSRQPAVRRIAPSAADRAGVDRSTASMYLMFDLQDRDTIKPLLEFFNQQGIRVVPNEFVGDQVTLRTLHQERLKNCDAALIVYGRVREPWVRMKQQDLLKAAGFGRATQMLAKGIYVGPDVTDLKRHFHAQEVMVIKDFDHTAPSALQPFVDQINAQREGSGA